MLPEFNRYCELLAALPQRYPWIKSSTLHAFTIGPFAAEIEGQITFANCSIYRPDRFVVIVMLLISMVNVSGGMIRKNILMIQHWLLRIHTTNMFTPTSNTIGFRRLGCHLLNRICHF